MSSLKERLELRVKEVDGIIGSYLPKKEGYQKTILDAMEYSVMAGGKRLRPLIMSEVFRLFGGDDVHTLKAFMAALEMIHTYSLVHDDLPAMDDDEYRRGRKTTHIVYGEAMGILAGDALLNYAYETAAGTLESANNIDSAAKALRVLAKKAGVYGMVGGQVVDVEMNGVVPDMDMLRFIYEKKTSALLEASFMIGGILAGASEDEVSQLEAVGSNIGIAFQIKDDILDVTSTTEILGKPVGSDAKNDKSTYVAFMGMEAALDAVRDYTDKAVRIFDELANGKDGEFLRELLISLVNREK